MAGVCSCGACDCRWDASGPWGRDSMLHATIDVWGERLLVECDKPGEASPELVAEVECLAWVLKRHRWIMMLPWAEIDEWIRAYYPQANLLPPGWSLRAMIRQARAEDTAEEVFD